MRTSLRTWSQHLKVWASLFKDLNHMHGRYFIRQNLMRLVTSSTLTAIHSAMCLWWPRSREGKMKYCSPIGWLWSRDTNACFWLVRFVLRDKVGRNAWPQEYYTEQQVKEISERTFGDFRLCCPGQPEEYLSRTYGDSWPRVGATHFFCHKSAGLLRQTVFDISKDQFAPAFPFN